MAGIPIKKRAAFSIFWDILFWIFCKQSCIFGLFHIYIVFSRGSFRFSHIFHRCDLSFIAFLSSVVISGALWPLSIVCTTQPPFLLDKGLNLPPNVQKKGLDRTSVFRGVCWKRRGMQVTFFRGVAIFRQKIKMRIFNEKKKIINRNVLLCHN